MLLLRLVSITDEPSNYMREKEDFQVHSRVSSKANITSPSAFVFSSVFTKINVLATEEKTCLCLRRQGLHCEASECNDGSSLFNYIPGGSMMRIYTQDFLQVEAHNSFLGIKHNFIKQG